MKLLYSQFIFLLTLNVLISCTSTATKDKIITYKKEYALNHKAYDTELLITRGNLALFDTLLLVVSDQNKDFCKVYSIPNNMKEVYSFGRIGNGPGEFLQPLLTYYDGNTFGLNELNTRKLAIMELIINNGAISIIEQARLKAPHESKKGELVPADSHFAKLDENNYVSRLLGGDERFYSLLDITLTHKQQFGESPIPEEISVLTSMNRLQGNIAANNGTMVFATSYLPYLASYKLINDKMEKQWSFYYNKLYYGVRNDDLLFDKEKSFGRAMNIRMDNKYIYILYLDLLLSEINYRDTEKSSANKILVFNHEGDAEAIINLDCRIDNMVISNDRTKLYGLAEMPEPTIVSFDMPKDMHLK